MEGNPFRIFRDAEAETTGKSGPVDKPEDSPQNNEVSEAPEGWKMSTPLGVELGISRLVVVRIVDAYRKSNPQYFGKFKDTMGNVREYYSPELIKIVGEKVENFKQVEKAPDGWKTRGSLCDELNVIPSTINKIVNAHRESSPEYYENYKDSAGKLSEHFSPALVQIIRQEIKKIKDIPKTPEGWETNGALAAKLKIADYKIVELANIFRATSPEDFKQFTNHRGQVVWHYSPALVELITEEIKKIPEVQPGWKTAGAMASELNVASDTVIRIADKYRKSNPDLFAQFRGKRGTFEYYAPELINLITSQIEKDEKAPDGWLTNSNVAEMLDATFDMVAKVADAYHTRNPEYFGQFKNKQGQVFEHYSPELIKIITGEIRKFQAVPKAPEGWRTNKGIASDLGVVELTISRIADRYRESNPEYFYQFKDAGNKVTKHYSPELVKIISDEIKSFSEPVDGWKLVSTFSLESDISRHLINKIADKYRKSNPEYFKKFKGNGGLIGEYYSPELLLIIKEEVNAISKAPDGWRTNGTLSVELGVDDGTVKTRAEKYRKSNPDYFKEYKDIVGKIAEHYDPKLVKIISEEIKVFKEIPKAPEGWRTNGALSTKLKIANNNIAEIADRYRQSNTEYFSQFKDGTGKSSEHYSPELVGIISEEILKTPEAPEGWKVSTIIAQELKIARPTFLEIADKYRVSHPQYFAQFRAKTAGIFEHYSPELVKLVSEEIEKIPEAPEGWTTNKTASRDLKVAQNTITQIVDKYRITNPEYFAQFRAKRGGVFEHYSPNLIKLCVLELQKIPKPPEGWKTSGTIAEEIETSKYLIEKTADRYRPSNPEYFLQFKDRTSKSSEHYSPELVNIIRNELSSFIEQKEEEKLKSEFENLAENIANPETADETARKIAEIIRLLPGNAHDIIIKYHPRYKGLHPDYVKQVIAEYLGDFMLVKNEWQPSDVQKLKEVVDIEGIQEEILLNLKNGCLTFVNSERKNNPAMDELAIVEAYFEKEQMVELAGSGIKEIENALNELREYYDSIFRLRDKKPGNMTDTLREGRTFPDINQLVNIQEIMDKKKMLIADEMGLGKSASAILTKEYLGLSCALVIMPSNVEDTWKNYLSDSVNEQGKQIGYFKQGLAPKTLVIESPADVERLRSETFDYILISQEKAGGEQYGKALDQVNFDMMIVDEVHKLKNIESGVRSQAVEALANKISGENKYLALLSGTPVPNKVKDIAVTLKLLYPEKYKDFDSKEMVKRILYGDLVDLRSELLKRMQMKELATSIEMPKLTEEDVIVELAPEEREIYEILLEEDELTALDKIMIFRQFLMNPEILKVEPGFVGSKIQKLGETLRQDLETQNKIVVFVNGYVEGVIKGEHNIIRQLNLPEGTIIEEIHGDISQAERARIQNELKSGDQKTVVFVSGQTADVGVDFSGADGMIEYNDPWSKYEKKQQQGRVYREGLKNDLVVKTLITKDSIEEGIRAYINAKEKAIEKLLKGIGNTEAEKKLLYNDSKLVNNDIETNAQLSKEYLSDWEKLMLHFGEGYESGEKRFRQELVKTGKEYADLYKKLGRLTYQGNNARVSATLIERMVEERGESTEGLRILDIASGPEMLKEASSGEIRDHIFSTDINIEHFATSAAPEKTMSASYLNLPVRDGSVDYANLGFAFHQTSPIKYYKKNYERLQVLAEMNRALKPGGRAVISMLHNVQFANMEKFEALVEQLGFRLVPEYTGEAKGKESYKAGIFTLEKVEDIPEYKSDAQKFDSADNAKYINALGDKLGREFLQGLEMSKTLKGKSRLRDQRRMIDRVTLGGKEIEVILNGKDKALLDEEVQSIQDGEDLRTQYGGIQNIPIEEIKRIGFERKLETPGYYLLYKIIKDGGAVIIRGDYKSKAKK